MNGRKDKSWFLNNASCLDDLIISPIEPTRQEKIANAISYSIRMGVSIPQEWVDEYNSMLKDEL